MSIAELTMVAVILLQAVLLIVVLVLALRMRAMGVQQLKAREALQADLRSLCSAAVQVGQRVHQIESLVKATQRRQKELGVRQEQLEVQSDPDERHFDQAIKLAQKGSSVEELMELCAISYGEAELITMMNRLGGEVSS